MSALSPLLVHHQQRQLTLLERYAQTRALSDRLAAPLSAEDAMVQSMPDASPSKWHLAHTTWFFERFVLQTDPAYRVFDPAWDFLFNSYYQSVGPMHARACRGVLSRPALQQVRDYRAVVDAQIQQRLRDGLLDAQACIIVQLGIQHEQQHQELLLTDIKHALWSNPLQTAYRDAAAPPPAVASTLRWHARDDQTVEIGAAAWPPA
ncbi:ergothioneine biosynthesis protein EgtB, partial [Acinetobacter baumannii]|uniref:DinB family protein n=1 Tax=Acinetobacter baumannii TaxID=470 RepID=UPI001EF12122